MLTIAGPASSCCDGISRRSFLRIGGLGLPEMLRAEGASAAGNSATTPTRKPAKGIIMVLLPGGPSHLDTFDLKPDAPAEIRGEFRPTATNVSGLDICEHLPRLAKMADKFAIIRSLVGFIDDHNTHWCTTGWESHPAMDASPLVPGFPAGGWPSLGSVLSRKCGSRVPGVPACVDITPIDPDARFILRTRPECGTRRDHLYPLPRLQPRPPPRLPTITITAAWPGLSLRSPGGPECLCIHRKAGRNGLAFDASTAGQ